MKIAITDIYGKLYAKDRLFDINACTIGENLLLPGVELKKSLMLKGHEYHTVDMYRKGEFDKIVFQEIPRSWYTLSSFKDRVKYVLKCGIVKDVLAYAIKKVPKKNRILLIMEPAVVAEKSYDPQYHRFFGKVLTWDDDIVDNEFYYKIYYPQPEPKKRYYRDFDEKKFVTMICGNKKSLHPDELYSKRRMIIDYFEQNEKNFDLYGVGWENEQIKNYKGRVEKKLETLSQYKFAVCFENQCNVKGYITEKIFDCFFTNCVPVYWGAENITEYIPENTFIDWRKYDSLDELFTYMESMDKNTYDRYLENIKEFLDSDQFQELFSVNAYVKRMEEYLLN